MASGDNMSKGVEIVTTQGGFYVAYEVVLKPGRPPQRTGVKADGYTEEEARYNLRQRVAK